MIIAVIPGVNEMIQLAPAIKEFGNTTVMLFIILLFMLSAAWVGMFYFGKRIEDIQHDIKDHRAASQESNKSVENIMMNLQSFRDSEKDLLANINDKMQVHFTKCDVMGTEMDKIADDVNVIGRGVDRLVTILTIARRKDNDNDGKG